MAWIRGSQPSESPRVAAPAPACVFCEAVRSDDDRRWLVVHRGAHAFLILNAYPYASGHVMAALNRHVGSLGAAGADELADAMREVQRAAAVLTEEYGAEGFNVGMNQGRVAGAGIEGHLHVHVVPRWQGDGNFMAVLADTRVLPESLEATWERLRGRLGG
jgi:ATP adenylyltransferase